MSKKNTKTETTTTPAPKDDFSNATYEKAVTLNGAFDLLAVHGLTFIGIPNGGTYWQNLPESIVVTASKATGKVEFTIPLRHAAKGQLRWIIGQGYKTKIDNSAITERLENESDDAYRARKATKQGAFVTTLVAPDWTQTGGFDALGEWQECLIQFIIARCIAGNKEYDSIPVKQLNAYQAAILENHQDDLRGAVVAEIARKLTVRDKDSKRSEAEILAQAETVTGQADDDQKLWGIINGLATTEVEARAAYRAALAANGGGDDAGDDYLDLYLGNEKVA